MNNTLTALDRETQLLVAAGSAVAAGCIPCLERIVGMARADGVDEKKIKEAVMTGQYVKEQPANMMKAFADKLVGTHLSRKPVTTEGGCPLSGEAAEESGLKSPSADPGCTPEGCGCSSQQR